MRDTDLYTQILGIKAPWQVSSVEVEMAKGEVTVHVEREASAKLCCPTCGEQAPGYDSRTRRWRHLDTCQCKTILVADVPRVKCPKHAVVTTSVPWAEPGSGFTTMFEALVIDWLKEASTSAVSRLVGLSWNAIDRIMQQAVQRGLARRQTQSVSHLVLLCYKRRGFPAASAARTQAQGSGYRTGQAKPASGDRRGLMTLHRSQPHAGGSLRVGQAF